MRRVVLYGLLTTRLLIAQNTSPQSTGAIEGRVTSSATGFGIPGVSVEIRSGPTPYNTTTDESGAYRLTGLKYGNYGSTISKTGYERGQDSLLGQIRIFGPDPVRFDIQMVPWTTLQGRVVDPDGKPAAKVRVRLGPRRDTESVTDEKGSFVFDKLSAGSYTLRAEPEATVKAKNGSPVETVPTYFPSSMDISQAETITIRGGDNLPNYEIRLRTSAVYRVRGVVLDEEGKPAPHATVKLLRPKGQGTQGYGMSMMPDGSIGSMVTGPAAAKPETEIAAGKDGEFEFPSVQPGDWHIQAEYDPASDAVERVIEPSGGTSIAVTGHDIDDIQIRLASPFQLDYSVDWGESKPPPLAGKMSLVQLMPLDGQPGPEIPAESRPYEVLAPGRYRIVPPGFIVPPHFEVSGFYVASVLLGGRDVLGQEVELTPGSPPLRVVVKQSAGIVRGTVEQGEGATVVLVSQSPQGAYGLSFIRTVKCGTGGTFEVPNLIPGDYLAWAFDRVDTRALLARSFPSGDLSGAIRVKVEESTTTFAQLRAARWR